VSTGLAFEFVSGALASEGRDLRTTGGCVADVGVGVGNGGGYDWIDIFVDAVDLRFLFG
jgi:hypothetical protein